MKKVLSFILIYLFCSLSPVTQAKTLSISGIALNQPADCGGRFFYLSTGTTTWQIYNHFKKIPSFSTGSWLNISGERSLAGGEERLKTKEVENFSIIGVENIPQPENFIDKIEGHEGRLIKLTGEILKENEKEIFIQTKNAKYPLVFKCLASNYNIQGEIGEITGLISRISGQTKILILSSSWIKISKRETKANNKPASLKESDSSFVAPDLTIKEIERKKINFLAIAAATIFLLAFLIIWWKNRSSKR